MFGQNLYQWLVQNVQPIVLAGLLVVGVYLMIERKISKVIGLIFVSIIAVGFVFATDSVRDFLLNIFNTIFA